MNLFLILRVYIYVYIHPMLMHASYQGIYIYIYISKKLRGNLNSSKICSVTTKGFYICPLFKCHEHQIIWEYITQLPRKKIILNLCLLLLPCRKYMKYTFFTVNINSVSRQVSILLGFTIQLLENYNTQKTLYICCIKLRYISVWTPSQNTNVS